MISFMLHILTLEFILINLVYTNNDCSKCTPDISTRTCNCTKFKPNCIYDNEECLYCEGYYFSQKTYYKIDKSSKSSTCQPITNKDMIQNFKLIYGTHFFKSDCPSGMKSLGDVCYSSQPPNTEEKDGKYVCKKYFYKEKKENLFDMIHCLPDKCNSKFKYYNADTNECLIAPVEGKKIKQEKKIIRYTDSCIFSEQGMTEYEYTEEDRLGKTVTYCVDKCPWKSRYYTKVMKKEDDGKFSLSSILCSKSCPKFVNGYECIQECDDKLIFIDLSRKLQICSNLSLSSSCPKSYPYKYNNKYCLKSCQDTLSSLFSGNENMKTYLLDEGDLKICTDSSTGHYIDESALKLVKDCSKSIYGPFHNSTHCVTRCEKKVTVDTYECVESCELASTATKKYLSNIDNVCYLECPNYLGRPFKDKKNKKCQTCNNPYKPSNNQNEEVGYYTYGNDICYDSCDEIPSSEGEIYYHNYGHNFCSNTPCNRAQNYKYSSSINPKVCYESCSEIKDGNKYNYEKDYICYPENPVSPSDTAYYLYDENSKITKIFKNQEGCLDAGYKFLKGTNCVKECSEDEYKILPSYNKLGACLKINADGTLPKNCIYYNQSKICSDKCNLLEIEDDEYVATHKENCVKKCPETLYENGNKCQSYCGSEKLHIDEPVKKCMDKCNYYKITKTGNNLIKKICVDKCTNDQGHNAYYLTTGSNKGKCVDSCQKQTDTNDTFSYDNKNSHQPCISKCPPSMPYYYDDNNHEKICLRICDKFYTNKNNNLICTDHCNKGELILPGNICSNLNECPSDAPYILKNDTNIRCLSSCPEEFPFYLKSTKECVQNCDKDNKSLYSENDCYKSFPNEFYDSNNKFNISYSNEISLKKKRKLVDDETCGGNNNLYYNPLKQKCYSLCLDSESPGDTLQFSYTFQNGRKRCVDSCSTTDLKYYDSNKICLSNCSEYQSNNIINDENNACVSSCTSSTYKYLEPENVNVDILHCKTECEFKKRYSTTDYICRDKCEYPYNYVVEKLDNTLDNTDIKINECLRECPKNYPYMRENDVKEYICSNIKCSEEIVPQDQKYSYFFMDTNICMKNCSNSFKYEYNSKNYCVSSCDFFQHTKLYNYVDGANNENKCVEICNSLNNQNYKFSRIDGFCGANCNNEGVELFHDNNNICLVSCPKNYTAKDDTKECVSCINAGLYIDKDGNCITDCSLSSNGYIYHNENSNECIDKCSTSFIKDNACVDSCDGDDYYIYDNYCVKVCPISRNYFNSIATEVVKTCLPYCPENLPYYTKFSIVIESETKTHFGCQENCTAYVLNVDPQNKASLCLGNKCTEEYKYFYEKNENNEKVCSSECPKEYPYYKKSEQTNIEDIQCFSKCPEPLVLDLNKIHCIEIPDCSTKKIDMTNRVCLNEDCGKDDKIYIKDEVTYCAKDCTLNSIPESITGRSIDLLESTDGQCIPTCDETISFERDGKCECRNLYYLDKTTQRKQCINTKYDSCDKYEDYPISVDGTKECVERCQGTLSVSGKKCFSKDYPCNEGGEGLQEVDILINGDRACKCKYKYYSKNNEIICLGENVNCPQNYKLITETKECVEVCPDGGVEFNGICVTSCPPSTIEEDHQCKCQNLYYFDENNNPFCVETENCPEDYPLLLVNEGETQGHQCIKRCLDDKYLLFNEKQCVVSGQCGSNRLEAILENEPIAQKYASRMCLCKNLWYYDEITGDEVCSEKDSESNDCSTLNVPSLTYKISSTRQCVSSCGDNYFVFGNQCFESCEKAGESPQQNVIQDGDTKMCKCAEYTDYENDMKCFTLENCLNGIENDKYSVIEKIKKCFKQNENKKCPDDYPIYFNGYCYKPGNDEHPENAKYNNFTQSFECENKWYNDGSKIICLVKESNCNQVYKFLVESTKECLKDELSDEKFYLFNYVYYLSCPVNTIKNGNKCECNKKKLYYSYADNEGKTLYKCSPDNCPDEKPYINNDPENKECLDSCRGMFIYGQRCVEKCPNLTEVGINNECHMSQVDNELNFDNLEKTMLENILELYGGVNNPISYISQKIATKDANIEFYGINKKHRGNSQQNVESDLSYIDISGCIDKIYNSHGLSDDNSDIIVLKFDVNSPPPDFMINPVEYRFIDSKTGNILDATICGHNNIKVSYPLHYLINIYDNRIKQRQLEFMQLELTSNDKESLREKLDKGKEIAEQYPDRDIFNMNDTIYSDICIPVVVDGKDLILKDRIDYFYPKMSFCENNCTYNWTDFINERIYCDCNFKTEFDFKRDYFPFMTIDEKITESNQGGSSNVVIIKCISNLKNLKNLFKNGGFIFMLAVIVVEVILLLIVVFYGINSLLNKLAKKMNDEEDEDFSSIDKSLDGKELKPKESESESMKSESESDRDKNAENNIGNPPKKKGDFGMEFIPQEYLFLFFNQNEKGVIKKVQKDEVPFKTKFNTRILLEQNKGVNYDNVKSRGPFPPNQNVLVLVDNMDESISDYLYEDKVEKKPKKKKVKVNEKHNISFEIKPKKKLGQTSDYDPSDENYSAFDFDEDESEDDEDHEKGFVEQLKLEQRLLNKNYKIAARNEKNSNFMIMLMAEILNLIYILKILLFSRKFDILSVQLSIYLLCHTLLLVLLGMFYDVETISRIWTEENFPGLGYNLLYGFYACLVIWVIYKIILCLWSSNDDVKVILRLIHINKTYGYNNKRTIYKKYNSLEYKIKAKVIVYLIIQFIILAFCFVYFVTFCSVYIGTKIRVFRSYGIALIEILIIKIIYGIILSILRKISLSQKSKVFYDIVLLMTTYLV